MEKIELDSGNFLTFRRNEWDEKVFGCGTVELLGLQYDTPQKAATLLERFDVMNRKLMTGVATTRIDAADKIAKDILQDAGFRYIETTMLFTLNTLHKFSRPAGTGTLVVPVSPPSDADFESIRRIARDAFGFSRYHEDRRIPEILARERYYRWIDDLRRQDKQFLCYKAGAEVVSFLAYHVTGGKEVELILAGSDSGKGFATPFFWISFLDQLKSEGYRKAKAMVSAANTQVVNLYAICGFRVHKSFMGFNKIYPEWGRNESRRIADSD